MRLIRGEALPSPARVREPSHPPYVVGLVQTRWHADPAEHAEVLLDGIRTAAQSGAQVVFLPELTLLRYPGDTIPEQPADALAEDLATGPTVTFLRRAAAEVGIPVHGSLYERAPGPDGLGFNTAVLVAPDGAVLANTRKLHIPQSEGYYENLYFRPGPGDDPFPVVTLPRADATGAVRLGLPTCWDQWFAEVARGYSLAGAQVLVYPTAIGTEPDHPGFDTQPLWQHIIVGHGIGNGTFMVVVNRWGFEGVLNFYGSSFVSDPYGRVLAQAPRDSDAVIVAELDLAQRDDWLDLFPLLTTRRPEAYRTLIDPVR